MNSVVRREPVWRSQNVHVSVSRSAGVQQNSAQALNGQGKERWFKQGNRYLLNTNITSNALYIHTNAVLIPVAQ